jgi:RHS repeat-associated protein
VTVFSYLIDSVANRLIQMVKDGVVTSFSYDVDGLLTAIDYPAGTADVSYSYDAAGNVVSMSDGLGSTTYSYDVLGQRLSRSRNGRTVSYAYTANGQVGQIGYWNRGSVQHGYDDAGRLTELAPWGAVATSYTWRSTGLLSGVTRPNGVNTVYSYDTASRLTGLNGIAYTLDANGNRIQMTDWEGVTSYSYDALDRLAQAAYPTSTVTYTLDSVGNRLSDSDNTFGYDASDRILNPGYTYDANGNLLSDGTATYEYDAANRLVRTTRSGIVTTYGYDGWGNLIQETTNGVTTEFVLDENTAYTRILGEVRSDGGERLYAYGPEGFTAQQTIGGGVEYPLLDGLGSVRHLTDAGGTVILSRSYDAYGNVRLTIGMGATRLGYTGEMQDPASGLVYLRARHYQPTLGRFLQRDSFDGFIQGPQSLNRYVYAEGNPVVYVDPSGHCIDGISTVLCTAAIGGAIGGGIGAGWYLANESQQPGGVDLHVDISFDNGPVVSIGEDWDDLLAAFGAGALAGAAIGTGTMSGVAVGAGMAANQIVDHGLNSLTGRPFSVPGHLMATATGAAAGAAAPGAGVYVSGFVARGVVRKGIAYVGGAGVAQGLINASGDYILDASTGCGYWDNGTVVWAMVSSGIGRISKVKPNSNAWQVFSTIASEILANGISLDVGIIWSSYEESTVTDPVSPINHAPLR